MVVGGCVAVFASAGVDVGVGVGVMPLLRKPLVCEMVGEGGCGCEVGMVLLSSGSATDVDINVASVGVCRSAIVDGMRLLAYRVKSDRVSG